MPATCGRPKSARGPAFVSLRLFLKHYFPDVFREPWGRDRAEALKAIEAGICGDRAAFFHLGRGRGKTSIILGAAVWAVAVGLRTKVAIVARDEVHAESMGEFVAAGVAYGQLSEDMPDVMDRLADAITFVTRPGRYEIEGGELVLSDLDAHGPLRCERVA